MATHLIGGEFQSDKYPTTPRGKVPLSVKDKTAQDLLWIYAQRRRTVDAEFSDDLEMALSSAGFEPSAPISDTTVHVVAYALARACADYYGDRLPDTFDTTLSELLARAAIAAMPPTLAATSATKAPAMAETPTKPGFYWAKWRIADDGTDDDGEGCGGPHADWEVVEVCENCMDANDPEYLRVAVTGVARSQSLGNFSWGPGPLHAPRTVKELSDG